MWQQIKKFFKDSETIAWSWFNMAIGFVAVVLTAVEPELITPFLDPKYIPIYILLNGLATKWLRERRADDLAS